MKKVINQIFFLGFLSLLAVGCSSGDPFEEVENPNEELELKNTVQTVENQEPVENQETEDNRFDWGWHPIIWEISEKSDNIRLEERNIYVSAPGGYIELIGQNYKWFTLRGEGGLAALEDLTEEEWYYAVTHLSGEHYRITVDGVRVTCEVFDLPENFTGELTEFIITCGDRYEWYKIIVEN